MIYHGGLIWVVSVTVCVCVCASVPLRLCVLIYLTGPGYRGERVPPSSIWTTTPKRHTPAIYKREQLPNNYPTFIKILLRNSTSMARVVVGVVVGFIKESTLCF